MDGDADCLDGAATCAADAIGRLSDMTPTIALIGDYSEEKAAHRAMPRALELAAEASGVEAAWRWVPSREVRDPERDLAAFAGVWVAPGSPYENDDGVLSAIRWARTTGKPFLGTCGGFQYALLEFSRNVAGMADAGNAETDPETAVPLIERLPTPLFEQIGKVKFAPHSRIFRAYGNDSAVERYRCSYGLNPRYAKALEKAGLRFTAWDETGSIRAAELDDHGFFLGTLFQPERAALDGRVPPVVGAFVRSVGGRDS